jgi:hypothetical protein
MWPKARTWVLPLCVLFGIIDAAFLIANGVKFLDGAWFPVVLGILVFTVLRTWRRGRVLLYEEIRKEGIQIDTFLPGLMLAPPVRVPGTAIFLIAQNGHGPARAAAQPQAQQGAARAQRVPDGGNAERAHRPKESACGSSRSATDFYRSCCASASWKPRTYRWR